MNATGPQPRESFFVVQARDRRASWKLAAACLLGVLIMGIALVLTLAPPLVAMVVLAADAISVIISASPDLFDMFFGSGHVPAPLGTWLIPVLILLPAGLVSMASWSLVSRLTRRTGVGTLLLRETTRDARAGDLEETQLRNVAAEMAIAAGLPAPELRLIDIPAMTAFAIGDAKGQATLVVSRALLDGLDRDETQAIVAHLTASVGNGDLNIVHTILTMYATVGLLEQLPLAPLDSRHRGTVLALLGSGPADDATIARDLYKSPAQEMAEPQRDRFWVRTASDGTREQTGFRASQILAWPLFYVTVAQSMCRLALLGLLVNPLVAMLWRRRRLLADASAVQLCREPSSLARALTKLSSQEAPAIVDPLMIFLLPATKTRGGWNTAGNFGGPNGFFPAPSLPRLEVRTERLRLMGAERPGMPPRSPSTLQLAGRGILALLTAALWAFCFSMTCLVLAAALFVGTPMAFFLLLLGPHIVLRGLIPWLMGH